MNKELETFYFTFGQAHAHAYGGKTFDKDCVVVVKAENSNEAREKMFCAFGNKWAFQYNEVPDMSFFPRGLLNL